MCSKILILSVFNFLFVSINGDTLVFRITEKYLGDTCTLANGSEGTCVIDTECKTISKQTNTELTRCEFENDILIICCPDMEKTRTASFDEPDLFSPPNHTLSRYNQILCENHELKRKTSLNVVNGKEANPGEFPYQVALGYESSAADDTYDFKCGGSLILNDIVITAAHCVHLKETQPVIVRLGRTSLVEDKYDIAPVVDVGIKEIAMHKKINRLTRENDIALIKLSKTVEFTDFIQPICISKNNDAQHKNLTVTGFGIVNVDAQNKSMWLMKGILNEKNIADCRTEYSSLDKTIFDSQICAFGKFGTDACQGDSGGPLILEEDDQDRLYGITSHGNGCGSLLPALYTRVDNYLDWIKMTIKDLDKDDNKES